MMSNQERIQQLRAELDRLAEVEEEEESNHQEAEDENNPLCDELEDPIEENEEPHKESKEVYTFKRKIPEAASGSLSQDLSNNINVSPDQQEEEEYAKCVFTVPPIVLTEESFDLILESKLSEAYLTKISQKLIPEFVTFRNKYIISLCGWQEKNIEISQIEGDEKFDLLEFTAHILKLFTNGMLKTRKLRDSGAKCDDTKFCNKLRERWILFLNTVWMKLGII
jgi:hypothetical protein